MSGDSRAGKDGKTRLRISNCTKISPSPCWLHAWAISQALIMTPQAPPTTVDYSVSYVGFQSDRGHLTSFLTSHSLKASREIISLPFHFSIMKKNTNVKSVMQRADSSHFQVHLTQARISLWRSLCKCSSRKVHFISSISPNLTRESLYI